MNHHKDYNSKLLNFIIIIKIIIVVVSENPSTDMPPVIQNYKYDLSTTYTEVQIRSPGFPLSYPMLSDINITITAPEGSNVAITFQYFNLEFSET